MGRGQGGASLVPRAQQCQGVSAMTDAVPTIATLGTGRQLGLLAEALVDAGHTVADGAAADLLFSATGAGAAAEGGLVIDLADNGPLLSDGPGHADAALVEHFPEDGARVLSLLVGADDDAFARIEAACGGVVKSVLHAGPFGAAHVSRALIHTMYLTLKNAAEEIVDVAAAHGVEAAEILSIINKSSGESLASKALYRLATEPGGGNADLHGEIEAAMAGDLQAALNIAADAGMSGFFARRVYDRLEIKVRGTL